MDAVDTVIEQWRVVRPDVDTRAMAVLGRLGRVAQHLGPAVEAVFVRYGLRSTGEFDVLAALRRTGAPFALGPSELARHLMLSPAAMTNRVDRLESAGLVARRPDPADRRGVKVHLTDEGLALVDAAVVDHVANEEKILSALSEKEQAQLDRLLRRLLASFEAV